MAIVILNAPPKSGKDTIANLLVKHYGFEKVEFKQRIYDIAEAILCVHFGLFKFQLADRRYKDEPQDYLGGLSPRHFLIKISEDWVKPLFGDDYFGHAASEKITNPLSKHYVFSDGGFPEEVLPLRDIGVPVIVVRLGREGYSFSGDSRSYLPEYAGHCTLDIPLVEGKPMDAVHEVIALLDFLNHSRIFQTH